MINPDNITFYDKSEEENSITINDITPYTKEEYNLFDQKDFQKYMKDIEKNVRDSFEYRYKLLPFLREYMNMNECSFYQNINNIDTFKIKIEIHHSPFTLYDICKIVFDKRSYYNQALDVQSVAEEVTLLHYCGLVGLIPLSETVHELVHMGYLFIPTTKVLGRYKDFIQIYRQWIDQDEEMVNILNKIEEYTELYTGDEARNLLSRKYTYIDFSGQYNLPKMDDIYQLVEDRINSLKYGIEMQVNDKLQSRPMIMLL